MSRLEPERLYRLLPAVYRVRDAEQGQPLRALLGTIEEELERIEDEAEDLYDNWFIETCDEWVVPYIGDLLGARPIHAIAAAGVSARAYVANTIAYRRRKGTAMVLEQLARDTTGWPTRVVEFFQRLATTQHLNHLRLRVPATACLRDAASAELAASAFDTFAHSADVRHAATRGGRYNIMNVGLFVWRLTSYALGTGTPADAAPDFVSARRLGGWWSIHPAGLDAPLFNRPRTEPGIDHLAEEDNVPGPLRRLALHAELESLRRLAAQPQRIAAPRPRFMTEVDPVLRLWVRLVGETSPQEVLREDIHLCSLPDEILLVAPAPRAVALDVERGRLAFAPTLHVAEVWVQHSYGFSGDLGAGPHDRSQAVRELNLNLGGELAGEVEGAGDSGGFFDPGVWQAGVSRLVPADPGAPTGRVFGSLRDAVDAWNQQPAGSVGVIVLMDSLSELDAATDLYASPSQPLEIEIAEGSRLLIVAGSWPLEAVAGSVPGDLRRRPGRFDARQVRAHFAGELVVRGTAPAGSAHAGSCCINGLMLEGHLTVAPGHLGALAVSHCTLLPGFGALTVQSGNERLRVTLAHSICGLVSVPAPIAGVSVADSIVGVDSEGGGSPDVSLDAPQTALDTARSSFFGAVLALSVSATDCIFCAPVLAERRQVGCVRFCFVPEGSRVPRRYRCQPDLAVETRLTALREAAALAGRVPAPGEEAALAAELRAAIKPLFVSREVNDPGFGQLESRCAAQIRQGAESGAEMGAFEFLKQPQREANLRAALDEYLRLGLEAGVYTST
ncbi:hypothetical protein [Xylophilus sp. GOD-11R]|uniref:hypothetical protein n=1 Tax=Xylophilus sp. GOD-11R TaxID=3089814 RepID=UPI00298C39DE|nr:hypothetical protein [Xylophilus sp. GOD-11R]WPB55019.1 hypothetical protein R9X41_12650 [Xylophilus sp. GOD-11R]